MQLLDHHLPDVAIEAAEALVDDHRLERPMLPTRVAADAERQAHGDAELLAAAEERDVDRLLAGDAVERLQLKRLRGDPLATRLAAQAQR